MDIDSLPDNPYLLLTPGPLSTTKTVKAAMLRDWCTWDDDYKELVQEVRTKLIRLADGQDRRIHQRPHAGKRDVLRGVGHRHGAPGRRETAGPSQRRLRRPDRADRPDPEDRLRLQRQRGGRPARPGKAGGDPQGGPGDHPCRRRPLRNDHRHAQPDRRDRQDRQEIREGLHRRRDEQLRRHPHRHRRRSTSISSSAAPTSASRGSRDSGSSSPRRNPC